jgi:hypothetical protein
MAFVDLKRSFVPVKKDEEANLSIGHEWGQRYAGWLSWAGLLERKRVILLAEALSGKSEEFKHAVSGLRAKGSFAFDTTVENLVDQAFLVKPDEQAALDRWKAGDEVAWFFLDSVDEARLNRKRLKDALLRLAASKGLCSAFASSQGARIQTSCSSSVVRITGMAFGWIGSTTEFGAVVRNPREPDRPSA